MDKEPITLNGLNKLKEELVFLKEKKRPEIVAAIAEARSHGDLKENSGNKIISNKISISLFFNSIKICQFKANSKPRFI